MSKEPSNLDPLRGDPLIDLLRQSSLPEPSPWFAARTLARLRHERNNTLSRWVFSFSWVRGAVFLALISLVATGWHLKTKMDNQKLTFSALEAVAQGEENPFCEEDPTWAENLF